MIYLLKDGEQAGPFTAHQLRSMWDAGAVTADTPFWREGMESWQTLALIQKELEPVQTPPPLRMVPPPLPQPQAPLPAVRRTRSVPTWGLAMILGGLFFIMVVQCSQVETPTDPHREIHAQVRSWMRANLNDPGSFDEVSWTEPLPAKGGKMIGLRYRAKNALGAKVLKEQYFLVEPGGAVKPVTRE